MIHYFKNSGGPLLAFSDEAGRGLKESEGLFFRNLSGEKELLPYEDWRLSAEERTEDLLGRLTLPQMAGLMLHKLMFGGEAPSSEWIERYYVHGFSCPNTLKGLGPLCEAVNSLQAAMEKMPWGIPALFTSEGINECGPRGKGGSLFSAWPVPLGIAASFDEETARKWGKAASSEYRAAGVTTALEPQVDIASEPRWNRFWQTYGESVSLTADLSRAFVDGMQTTEGAENGWGTDSVCAVAKHFPGGGTGEGGRDAHFAHGKYAVYPGNRFEEHLKTFTEGVMKLNGPTKEVAYIMPYYTISWNQDRKYGENVGNGFSRFMLTDLLRDRLGYRGGIFSDFGITLKLVRGLFSGGKGWGVEEYSIEARHVKSILAGMDFFGKDEEGDAILEAVHILTERLGEKETAGILKNAVRYRLKYAFLQGMFENPYLDAEASGAALRTPAAVRDGFEAQLKSVILLKNSGNVLPVRGRKTVYIPKRRRMGKGPLMDLKLALVTEEASGDETEYLPVSEDTVRKYYDITDDPEKADFALVFMEGPECGNGWSREDIEKGGNGYIPISLQYRPYTAELARAESIAGGDIFENFTNRSYKGKTVTCSNESDLDTLIETRKKMGDRPVIVSLYLSRPMVLKETEPLCDAILTDFGVETEAVFELLSGRREPSGLLPMQMPADMETVETQLEDVPFDMRCYRDADGHEYDFAFGMDYSGVIEDSRTEKYGRNRQ